jgi:amino acid adenylation domain-containing protein
MSDANLDARLAAGAARLERLRHGLSEKQRQALERRLHGLQPGAPAAAAAVAVGAAIPRRAEARVRDAAGEPLSFAQERLWFLAQLEPASPAYNLAAAVRLVGEIHLRALAGALAQIVRRHESLRTVFVDREGQPEQVISPPPPPGAAFALPVVELGSRRARAEVPRLAAAAARRPFDLAAGPLLRAVVLRESATRAIAVLTLHHIVADAWSMGVLVRELAALYGALADRGAPARRQLPELPIQYADFARWQRQWLAGAVLDDLLAYWRHRLAGLPPEIELPADRPHPAVPSGCGGRHPWSSGPEAAASLRVLAQESGATLFMALLAAFAGLLGRLGGQLDVAVGAPVAGRTRIETEGLIGFFVNTLVLRLDLSGTPDCRALLARARETTLGAFAHQELPFERLVAELRPDRAAAHNPLFQVAFVLQNAPAAPLRLPGLTLDALPVPTGGAMFDLTFEIGEDGGGGLAGHLDYSRDRFDAATAARLAHHFATLLAAVGRTPGSRFADLPLLDTGERHQLLHEWRGGALAFPRDATLHGLFAGWARRTPRAIALQWTPDAGGPAGTGGRLTYGELAARAARLASQLRGWGVRPEQPVALCLARGPRQVVAVLAVLEAGGAYLPLDPSSPREHHARILDDLLRPDAGQTGGPEPDAGRPAPSPPLLLTEQRFVEALAWVPRAGGRLICLDAWGAAAGEPDLSPAAPEGRQPVAGGAATAENLAYVIYTSGSSGRPKGVAVTHRAAVRLVRGSGFASFAPDEVFLALAPLAFDVSTLELWGPLANGGRLALMPPGPPALAEIAIQIERHRVTTLWLTAGLFHQMVDEQLDGLRPVRQLIAGGDALSPAHARRVLDGLPATCLINGYGPTENTTFTCCGPLPAGAGPAALPPHAGVPIGRPIANTEVFVLAGGPAAEPFAALAPVGVAGELVTGGEGLARGYYRRPDLTAERFRPHPFAASPGERLYHTGDRVRFLADGRLDFLGRVDRQVKVRGFRIEPGEVEAALAAHPAVAAAVVTAVAEPGAAGGKRLVAYLVPRAESAAAAALAADRGMPGQSLPPPLLRAWLRERLPDYMVPHRFVALAELPLTANFKLDRAALPCPEWGADELDTPEGAGGRASRAPRTPEEDVLAGIWAEVLGRERVGIDEDFFALGGHSLLATRVVSRVRAAFTVELPLRRMFEAPTVAALARVVIAARRQPGGGRWDPGGEPEAGAAAAAAAIASPGPRQRPAEPPLSFAQERLWFLAQLEPGNPAYNLALPVALHGELAPAALAGAVAEVTRRHEALRTRFPARDGRPWQEVAAPLPPDVAAASPRVTAAAAPAALPAIDLHRLPEAARQAELDRQLAAMASRPFDLARGPLVRWALLRLLPSSSRTPAAGRDEATGAGEATGTGEAAGTIGGTSPVAGTAEIPSGMPGGAAHVFVCVQHHIVTDGWSLGVLLRELAALYAAFSRGRQSPLPPPPLQYADFALWQREQLDAGALAPQLAYWRERLAGELPVLALPADRPRLPWPGRGGQLALPLTPELSARVAAYGRRAGATPFMTLLAAWKVLLHRLSGQDDVLVGVPIAGRNQLEIEDTLGFFVNTLVLRTDLGGNPPFAALLARVREGALAAYAHQDLPFERLVAELQPERNLAHSPLVQVFFNHLSFASLSPVTLGGLVPAAVPVPPPPAKFEVTVYAAERQGSFQLQLLYDASLFSPERIAEMARQLEHLLAVLTVEDRRAPIDAGGAGGEEPGIDDVPLITAAAAAVLPDPARMLAGTAAGAGIAAVEGAAADGWLGLFARSARCRGSRLAAADEEEGWTYAELEGAANRLARVLTAAGLASGEVVAVAAERRAALAWAVLGAAKARGAFLLLDPAYPPARRAAMLRLAGARAFIRLPAPPSSLPNGAGRNAGTDAAAQIAAGGLEPEIAAALADLPLRCTVGPNQAAELTACGAADPGPPAAAPAPDDLAYVAFTSGSTGGPKAVAGTHAPLSHFFSWYAAAFGLTATDRFGLLAGLGHDPLLRDLLAPLTLGAVLRVPPAGDLEHPERLVGWLAAREVSVIHLTPAFGQLLAQGAGSRSLLPALRLACFGGDLLTAADVQRLRALAPAARVVNVYGATETPQVMGWLDAALAGLAERGTLPIPIGRGIDGVELLVRNSRGGWAGVGELGEIVVRSPFLARGYLGDEALTRRRFLPDPAGGLARLYRTGDLGRYRPDGSVELAGRADRQLKIRGFRIEPAEIEAALAAHPAVAEAAVMATGTAPADTGEMAMRTPPANISEPAARQAPAGMDEPAMALAAPGARQPAGSKPAGGAEPEDAEPEGGGRPAGRSIGEASLAAFVVAKPGAELPPAGELRRHLALRLPAYMLPARITRLDRLPLTPNGKLDRRALERLVRSTQCPHAQPDGALAASPRLAPRDPIEEVVAGIWEEVLGTARTGGAVGPGDDFFALGGHSLLATQVLSRVRQAFGVEVPLRHLFMAPTPAGLAAAIAAARAVAPVSAARAAAPVGAARAAVPPSRAAAAVGAVDLSDVGAEPPVPPPLLAAPRDGEPPPLSFAQESLWFFEQHAPGTAAYNMPLALRLRGRPHLAALAAALAQVARRHEALRTCFAERSSLGLPGSGPVQVIAPPGSVALAGTALLPLVDLSRLTAARAHAAARALAAAEGAAPFDLARAPLWRARLLRLAAADHVLLLTAHHIVCDAWSIGVMAAELDALYGALVAGRPSPLQPLAVQYADYARWQRRWLAGPALAALLARWRRLLAGAPPLLELPTDRPRPARPRHRGARVGWQLPPILSATLAGIARRRGATPFMLLLAAFESLLARYSGQEDLVLGLSIAHRNRTEIEPLIGFLVNLLALRADLRHDPPFAELLERVRDSTLDALAWQDLPFELLVAELRPERGLAHSPLFQVLCTWQSAPLPAALASLELEPFPVGRRAAHFDWTLSLAAGGPSRTAALAGYLEVDLDLFDAATARRAVTQLEALLAALAAAPERRLSELAILGEVERQQLREWSDTAAAYPAGSCLHELIAAQARRTPAAPAVAVAGGTGRSTDPGAPYDPGAPADPCNPGDAGNPANGQLSFAVLATAAGLLAARLRALGVGPGALVALYLERSAALAVAVLAVLEAGGAYLPLDLAEPSDRLAWLLGDARPRVALTSRAGGLAARLLAATEGGEMRIVCLDDPAPPPPQPAGQPARPPAPRRGTAPTPDDLAYVIYTSGSTGRPKATMVTHRAVVNYLSWAVVAYEIAAGGGAPVHTPLAFDLTVTSLLLPWLAGRCALLVPESEGVEGLGLTLAAPLPAALPFSLVKLTPAHLSLLAEQPGAVSPGRTRALVVGGEALAGESLAAWRRAAPETLVVNEYGPTEATVGCCIHREAAGALADGPVPIGRPIANVRLYVVDAHLRSVPQGASGELLIGGDGLARGYLRRSALTAERFVPDPFGDSPGGRLYRTGDRARQRAGGVLEVLGRCDEQVKVRGFRIEMGEVEAALASHPGLSAVAIAAHPAVAGSKRLVAYVVPHPGAAAPPAAELRRHLAARLPEFMLPGVFIPLPALPLTTHGKVDRKALPPPPELPAPAPAKPPALAPAAPAVPAPAELRAPGQAALPVPVPSELAAPAPSELAAPAPSRAPAGGAAGAADGGPPRTAVETALAGLWEQLLRRPRVEIDDNFFELGGDSILSLQLASRARAIGLRFRSRDLFQHQTIARLAAALEVTPEFAPAGEPPPVAPVASTPVVAATAVAAAAPVVAATAVIAAAPVAAAAALAGRPVVIEPVAAGAPPAPGPADEVPLLPIQRWFFAQHLAEPWHYNHAILLSLRRPLAPSLLSAACAHLMLHHEALRLRFERIAGTPGWRQRVALPAPPTPTSPVPFACLDLSRLEPRAAAAALEAAAAALQGSLDLAAGPIVRLAHFALPPAADGQAPRPAADRAAAPAPAARLLLVVHHLAIDGVSWRILLEDLETALAQLERREPVRLPAPPTSLRQWAQGLAEAAASPELATELDWWLAVPHTRAAPLPVDRISAATGRGFAAAGRSTAAACSRPAALHPPDRDSARGIRDRRAPRLGTGALPGPHRRAAPRGFRRRLPALDRRARPPRRPRRTRPRGRAARAGPTAAAAGRRGGASRPSRPFPHRRLAHHHRAGLARPVGGAARRGSRRGCQRGGTAAARRAAPRRRLRPAALSRTRGGAPGLPAGALGAVQLPRANRRGAAAGFAVRAGARGDRRQRQPAQPPVPCFASRRRRRRRAPAHDLRLQRRPAPAGNHRAPGRLVPGRAQVPARASPGRLRRGSRRRSAARRRPPRRRRPWPARGRHRGRRL